MDDKVIILVERSTASTIRNGSLVEMRVGAALAVAAAVGRRMILRRRCSCVRPHLWAAATGRVRSGVQRQTAEMQLSAAAVGRGRSGPPLQRGGDAKGADAAGCRCGCWLCCSWAVPQLPTALSI